MLGTLLFIISSEMFVLMKYILYAYAVTPHYKHVACFPELVFQFSVAQVLVGLRKQFISNFVFPTWAWSADFNINNNNVNISKQKFEHTVKVSRS